MTNFDYTVKTYPKRLKIVKKMLEENAFEIERYFDDLENTYNYLLEMMANYLIYDAPQRKEQENFENMAVALNEDNYYLENKTKIFKKDLEKIPELRELGDFIEILRTKARNTEDFGEKRVLRQWISDLRQNQILIKQMVARPIFPYCKQPAPYYVESYDAEDGNSLLNLDLFEDESWRIILQLLPFRDKVGERVDRLVNIFNKIYPLVNEKLRPIERKIVNIYATTHKGIDNYEVLKNKDLANRLKITQKEVSRYVESLCHKLCEEYIDYFEDNVYYTYLVRGKYKTCSKCGENKIVQKFNANKDSADGRQSICRDCLKSMYKTCSCCGQKLPKESFGMNPNTKDGLQSWCKNCDLKRKF